MSILPPQNQKNNSLMFSKPGMNCEHVFHQLKMKDEILNAKVKKMSYRELGSKDNINYHRSASKNILISQKPKIGHKNHVVQILGKLISRDRYNDYSNQNPDAKKSQNFGRYKPKYHLVASKSEMVLRDAYPLDRQKQVIKELELRKKQNQFKIALEERKQKINDSKASIEEETMIIQNQTMEKTTIENKEGDEILEQILPQELMKIEDESRPLKFNKILGTIKMSAMVSRPQKMWQTQLTETRLQYFDFPKSNQPNVNMSKSSKRNDKFMKTNQHGLQYDPCYSQIIQNSSMVLDFGKQEERTFSYMKKNKYTVSNHSYHFDTIQNLDKSHIFRNPLSIPDYDRSLNKTSIDRTSINITKQQQMSKILNNSALQTTLNHTNSSIILL